MSSNKIISDMGKRYLDMVHEKISYYSSYLDKIAEKNSTLIQYIYNYLDKIKYRDLNTKIGIEDNAITIETTGNFYEKLYIEMYNNPIKTMLLSTPNFLVFFKDDEIEFYNAEDSLNELCQNSLDSISTEETITFKEDNNNIICNYQKNNITTNNIIGGDKRKQIYSEQDEVVFKPKRKVFKNI